MFQSQRFFPVFFIAVSVLIALASLVISNYLVKDLAREERNKMEIWATAAELLAKSEESSDMALVLKVLQTNTTIPVILFDESTGKLSSNNIAVPKDDYRHFLQKKKDEFAKKHDPIRMDELNQSLYYDDSTLLKRLHIFPYIQLLVIAIFVALAFFGLYNSQRAEQNKVWKGLSKETAHQLGTPISSLLAWTEYLKLKSGIDESLAGEIEKDVERLNRIAERFSKIGSNPDLHPTSVQRVVTDSVSYLQNRISRKISIKYDFPESPVLSPLNASLFAWVIENIVKNAVDAMEGQGRITFTLEQKGKFIFLDISDTGKGIPRSKQKTVFSPGFTTKQRGWGLGLSLAKRIVEQYHRGKIFVKASEIGKGTTFRIVLRSA
ncbi:MAG: sensor histidine kinase [Bacteroidota bacterium]